MYLIVLSIKLFIYFFNNLFLLSIKKNKNKNQLIFLTLIKIKYFDIFLFNKKFKKYVINL